VLVMVKATGDAIETTRERRHDVKSITWYSEALVSCFLYTVTTTSDSGNEGDGETL
jgi:hypothetical protein